MFDFKSAETILLPLTSSPKQKVFLEVSKDVYERFVIKKQGLISDDETSADINNQSEVPA